MRVFVISSMNIYIFRIGQEVDMFNYIYKHQKLIIGLLVIVLIISLIPIFMVAGVDCASGDDYNYGAHAHQVYLKTGSVIETFIAAAQTTVGTWNGWQGTWFDCFVFCLHPEVFCDSAYVVVPFIFLAMQIWAFMGFAHHFLKVRWRLGNSYWAIVGLIFLLFTFQLVPSQKSSIFWWTGCVHYAMPMCMALYGIVLGDRFITKHRIKDFVMLCLTAALIGGTTYPAALLMPMGIFLIWLAGMVFPETQPHNDSERYKRNVLLLIPLLLNIIGLVISVIAPGNAIRSASDIRQGASPSGGAISTIVGSIIFSVKDALGYFIAEKTMVIIEFIIVAFISACFLARIKDDYFKDYNLFGHPLLFVVVMFLLNASMYAPRLYAGGVVSSGYYNFNFWVFSICTIATIIYLCGFFFIENKVKFSNKMGSRIAVVVILACAVIVYMGRHGIKEYTDFICLEYYLTGQAADYKEQMALQHMLMEEDGVDDVVVPEVNNEQGPLMQMPIVADPHNVDNIMTASFYGKNSCRAIPRNEWIVEYGEKYDIK